MQFSSWLLEDLPTIASPTQPRSRAASIFLNPALLMGSPFEAEPWLAFLEQAIGACSLGTWGDQQSLRGKNSHLVLALQAADGSVFAVKAVLQVDPGLANEVICPDHVMVVDQDGEQGLLWERGLDLK